MKTDTNQESPEQPVVVNNNATVKQPTVKEPEVVKQQVQQADIVATQVRTSSVDTNAKINVAHNIFVSLKKGLITDYYKVGKTLGEGNFFLSQ